MRDKDHAVQTDGSNGSRVPCRIYRLYGDHHHKEGATAVESLGLLYPDVS